MQKGADEPFSADSIDGNAHSAENQLRGKRPYGPRKGWNPIYEDIRFLEIEVEERRSVMA